MYRLDTGQARVDLYDIGKGAAQVLDLSPLRQQAAQENQQNFAREQQNKKDKAGREDDVNTQLAGLNKLAVFDRDRPKFAQMQNDLFGYVKENIDKIRNGDSTAYLGFQNMLGNIYTEAELSKNAREQYEKSVNEAYTKGYGNYRTDGLDKMFSFSSPENIGNYDISEYLPKQNVNYNERVVSKLAPYAQQMAKDSPLQKVFTKKQAKELLYNDLYSDPSLLEQANYDFNKASKDELEKLGNPKDAIGYYQEKFAPSLIVNDTKEAYYTGFGDKDKTPKVAGTYTKQADGKGRFQFEYTNTQDNPYITIKDPNNSRQSINVKPIAVNFDGRNTKLEGAVQLSESQKAANAAAADGSPKPYSETIDLDYNQVSDVMHNKFAIDNVFDIQNGKAPKHVTVKYNDVSDATPKQDAAQPKTVKRGQIVEGYKFLGGDTKDPKNWQQVQ
jgi:hypothetical protein